MSALINKKFFDRMGEAYRRATIDVENIVYGCCENVEVVIVTFVDGSDIKVDVSGLSINEMAAMVTTAIAAH